MEKEYPNILFAKDGEIFDLDGLKAVVIGGAHSIDKMMRIEDRLEYKKWYCGHYHTEKKIDKLEIMFENFDVFCNTYDST